MSDVVVSALDNGPLKVTGSIQILDGQGNLLETKETAFLCRCGLSANKPYCNGAHKGKFESEVRANG